MVKGVSIEYGAKINSSFKNIYLKENIEIALGVYLHAYDIIKNCNYSAILKTGYRWRKLDYLCLW